MNFHVSRTGRKDLEHFEKCYAKFLAQIMKNPSRDVVRQSYEFRASIANLSPPKFGEFTMRQFCDTRTNLMKNKTPFVCECRETLSRMTHDCRTSVSRLSYDSRDIYLTNKTEIAKLSHKSPFNENAI